MEVLGLILVMFSLGLGFIYVGTGWSRGRIFWFRFCVPIFIKKKCLRLKTADSRGEVTSFLLMKIY